MKKLMITLTIVSILIACTGKQQKPAETAAVEEKSFHGFPTQAAYGEHLVNILDCKLCHTPKIMTPRGPEIDQSLLLSGHPANMPFPGEIDRKQVEKMGLMTSHPFMTAFAGPWGISYAANLTPDPTGIGNWSEEVFINAIKDHKYKGLKDGRSLLPPMPVFPGMTDDEIKAIFTYLKTVPPVKNIVPDAVPPVSTAS